MWAIKLGCTENMKKVGWLYKYFFSPQQGNLESIYNTFCCLQKNLVNNTGRIVFDGEFKTATYEAIWSETSNNIDDWKDLYPDSAEATPRNLLETLGYSVTVREYVDENHAGNMMNRFHHSGLIIYVKKSPVIWYSKRKNKVESYSFGS